MSDTQPAASAAEQKPETPPRPAVPRPKNGRVLLLVAAALFVGWMSWLGYTALTKSQAPVVSRAQAADATAPVVAELAAGEDGRSLMMLRRERGMDVVELKEKAERPAIMVKVVESFKGGPEKGASIGVFNLPDCTGYTGPGTYLLLLKEDKNALIENAPAYRLVGAQRSPGSDPGDTGSLRVYPWNDKTSKDLRKQVEKLFP